MVVQNITILGLYLHLFINFRQFSIDLYDFGLSKFSFGSHYAVHREFSELCCALKIT